MSLSLIHIYAFPNYATFYSKMLHFFADKVILDEKVVAKNIFKGNVEDVIELPEKRYSINSIGLVMRGFSCNLPDSTWVMLSNSLVILSNLSLIHILLM